MRVIKKIWNFIITDDRTGKKSKTAFIQFFTFIIITVFIVFISTIVTLDAFDVIEPISENAFKMIQESFKYMFEVFVVTTIGYNANRFIKSKWGSLEAKPAQEEIKYEDDEDDDDDEEDEDEGKTVLI